MTDRKLMIDCPRCGHCCPQRPWVGLTNEEIMDCTHHMTKGENETWVVTDSNLFEFAHILEEWLKGKNK